RTTRQIALTAAGEVYLSRASAILADLENLQEEAREATGEMKGKIRVSAARTFGDAELGLSLVDFAKEHPDISLDIHLDDNFVNLVEEGFDVAIRMTRLADSAMIARRLASLDFAICASPELLKRLGRPTHPSEVSKYPAVIDSNSRMFSNWIFRDPKSGETIPVTVSGQFTANSPVTVRAAAIAGLGLALSPTFVIRNDLASGKLVTVLDEYMPSEAGIYAVFPHRRHLPARVRLFVDFLAAWFRKCDAAKKSAA
ncbi:MAG TPA: LysR substrate-binding domain-containing protein, partial [Paracoccaceae bacterium]|nr:LysR substrate-binding domain-containing protein [Paracoccaceae bacterium]